MDPEAFLDLANQVTKLKMYPYFEIAHAVITCLYVRDDLAGGSQYFSRKHPLSCWLSSMLSIFAGGILASFLLGEPVLGAVKSNQQLALATIVCIIGWTAQSYTDCFKNQTRRNIVEGHVWSHGASALLAMVVHVSDNGNRSYFYSFMYLIFYSPFDIVYKICKFLPIKVVLSALKEVIRCKKVHDGVIHAAKLYPNSYLIMVMIGTIKGNGSGFLKVVERLFRGVWTPSAFEIMQPSFPTKACIVASVIFVLDKKTDYISAPHALVYFGVVIFFVYFKLSSVLLGIHDPFGPFENLFCAIFMGGVWDALSQAISGKGDGKDGKKNGKSETLKKD